MSNTLENVDENIALNSVIKAIESIKFGSVEVIIHDGKITQIERKEKKRFNQSIKPN